MNALDEPMLAYFKIGNSKTDSDFEAERNCAERDRVDAGACYGMDAEEDNFNQEMEDEMEKMVKPLSREANVEDGVDESLEWEEQKQNLRRRQSEEIRELDIRNLAENLLQLQMHQNYQPGRFQDQDVLSLDQSRDGSDKEKSNDQKDNDIRETNRSFIKKIRKGLSRSKMKTNVIQQRSSSGEGTTSSSENEQSSEQSSSISSSSKSSKSFIRSSSSKSLKSLSSQSSLRSEGSAGDMKGLEASPINMRGNSDSSFEEEKDLIIAIDQSS
jgi:hypothetical protein